MILSPTKMQTSLCDVSLDRQRLWREFERERAPPPMHAVRALLADLEQSCLNVRVKLMKFHLSNVVCI